MAGAWLIWQVQAEAEDPVSTKIIAHPPEWRRYQTQAGNAYYYDPATEMIHYLSSAGNYAVDPKHSRTFTYHTLDDLRLQMARRPGSSGSSRGQDLELMATRAPSQPGSGVGESSSLVEQHV